MQVTGLTSDTLARLLIDIALGSAFDSPATGEVSPGQVMGEVLEALTRSRRIATTVTSSG